MSSSIPLRPKRRSTSVLLRPKRSTERWRRQHLRSRAGGSALRRTLGVHLGLVERKLNIRTDGRFYPPEVESAISAFLLDCEVAFVVANSPEDARTIESKLIQTLRPSLNVKRS